MHVSNGSSRKRKKGERAFRFESFCEEGYPTHFNGSFHENIMALIEFGHGETGLDMGMKCWSFRLELDHHSCIYVKLFIVEEMVEMSLFRHCHHCRSVGWGHHMICNKRFHLVLSSRDMTKMVEGLRLEAILKGTTSSESQGYLMHGVMHANGFGHLVWINGIEGGSKFISGTQILLLWDRICTTLNLRKVSLVDIATKGKMELRLIYGIAYGHPWFGLWGYKFGRGSYGISQQVYHKSLEALRAFPLCLLVPHFSYSGHELAFIIAKYQAICCHSLLSLGDLLRFMLELKNRLPVNSITAADNHGIITEATCRWSAKRVEMAAQVIVGELKKSEFRWVSRQEVRDAARAYIGDTGLLDYVLKSLGNHVFGNYIVRRVVNPVTKVLEYSLEDISGEPPCQRGGLVSCHSKSMVMRCNITRVQLRKDLLYLHRHIFRERRPAMISGMFELIPVAVRVVLDTKYFVKDYQECSQRKIEVGINDHIKLMCTVRVVRGRKAGIDKELPPYELVTVPANTTVGGLKKIVEKQFREMYWGLKNFIAEILANVAAKDSDLVLGVLVPGHRIVIEGRLGEKSERVMYESGNDERTIDCQCGAKEEDGEQMISCDICEVWMHTRCVGIAEGEEVPSVFLCGQCEHDIVAFPSIHY